MGLDVVAARRLLGVHEGASQAQLKAAYRVMLKAWHPDCVRRRLDFADSCAAVESLRTEPVLAGFSAKALVRIAEIVAADREQHALDEAVDRTQEITAAFRTLRRASPLSRSARAPRLVYQPPRHVSSRKRRVYPRWVQSLWIRLHLGFLGIAFGLMGIFVATPQRLGDSNHTAVLAQGPAQSASHAELEQTDTEWMDQQQD